MESETPGDDEAVDREPWPSTYDVDHDGPGRGPTRPSGAMVPSRRLLVNPFLSVSAFVVAVLLLRSALHRHDAILFFSALGILAACPYLTQSHCLDCGRTIWVRASGRHACPPALARWRDGRPDGWAFPSPRAQVSLWLHVLVPVAVLLLILFVFSHRGAARSDRGLEPAALPGPRLEVARPAGGRGQSAQNRRIPSRGGSLQSARGTE